jgi:Domain of unknown function (DUF4157)
MKANLRSTAIRILALVLMLLPAIPTPALAQDNCSDVNQLMTFDYRSWGIGVHRSCEWYDLPCHALKAKQIALGAPVQAWILLSREAAISAGVSPIPPQIRTQLAHLYPAPLLDSVRFKTGSGFLGSLQWFRSEMEGKGAITLKEVIVFANASDAMTSVRLWAHELEHVRQYGNLGVDGFAQAYVDQTCILPGDTPLGGYDSGQCQLERWADRKQIYFNQSGFVLCCSARNQPPTLALRDRILNGTETFIARDSITVGPNVVLQAGGDVTFLAGRIINLTPGFRTEPGGRLSAAIDPGLNQACTPPAIASVMR